MGEDKVGGEESSGRVGLDFGGDLQYNTGCIGIGGSARVCIGCSPTSNFCLGR